MKNEIECSSVIHANLIFCSRFLIAVGFADLGAGKDTELFQKDIQSISDPHLKQEFQHVLNKYT